MSTDEKMVTRVEMRCTEEFKAAAEWAAGRHEQALGPWIKSLVVDAVRRERFLVRREERAAAASRRRQDGRARRKSRK